MQWEAFPIHMLSFPKVWHETTLNNAYIHFTNGDVLVQYLLIQRLDKEQHPFKTLMQ